MPPDAMRQSAHRHRLAIHGLVDRPLVLDADTLAGLRMPDRTGFTADARPDVPAAGR